MKLLKLIALYASIVVVVLCVSIIFTGCSAKAEPEMLVQHDTKIEYILPPETFTTKIKVPEPVSKDSYMKMNYKDKEKALGIYIIDLINIINIENGKKEEIKKYIDSKKGGPNASKKI